MKKLLRRFFTLGLAIATLGATAQTLTQEWVYKTDIPAAGDAKWGCGNAGQIWVSNTTTKKLMYWDAEGAHTLEVGTAGPAICIDDAGNVIVSTTPWSAAATALKVLPKGSTTLQDLTITLPEGVTAGTMKFLGRAVGDVMSETGGAFCEFPNGNTKVAKIFVAKGAQVAEKSFAADAGVTPDAEGLAVLVDNDPESTSIAARTRLQYDFYLDGTALARLNINTTQGGDVFMIGDKLYSVEPVGSVAYVDAFEVVDRSGDAPVVIASHAAEFETAAAKPNPCSLSAEVVDDYTVNIYQYVPGQMAAKYVLALPKPMPKLEARNAYAYDIVVEKGETEYTVSYRLNAPASAVKIQLMSDGEIYKEYAGTTLAEYANEEKTAVNNLNTVKIPTADLKVNATTKFFVSVESDVVTEATAHSTTYSFWSPYGAVVDNNPNSKHFGRLLVTEAQSSLPATGYLSSTGENGIGTGIYAFDQTFLPIKNSEGKYGFLAGMEREEGNYAGTSTSIYDFKRLALAGDGRLFISRAGVKSSGVWELDPDNLEASATPVFTGTLGEDGMITDANGNIVSGPATAMDVVGSNWGLKLAIVSCNGGYALSKPSHKVYVYNLGVEKTWGAAPSNELTSLDNLWINSATVNLRLDPDGNGLMVGQYRATPSESEPAYKHATIWNNEVDYSDVTSPAGGAGMAWNADNTLFAMSTGKGKVGIFTVTNENGPQFTKLYEIATGCGTNTNAIAFDYANNLYVVSNSGEKLRCFALPRESGEVVVPAGSQYDATISSDEYPAALYIIGTPTNWVSDKGIKMDKGENGVFTAELTNTAAYCNIGLTSVLSTDWNEVNANRWGFANDNEEITLGQEHAIEKTIGAMLIKGEAGSTYQVKVDMKNMTILVTATYVPTSYPEKLYMVGSLKDANWDISSGKYELTTESEGIYSIGGVEILDAYNGNGYFAFGAITTDNWAEFNALRYGPATSDTPVTEGTATAIDTNGDTSYMITAGVYDVKVDLTTKLLLMTKTSGIEYVEADATDVVPGYGEISIITSVENTVTSIYSTAGKAIVLNSAERQFTVESGIYVVVVNGKSYKVAVR